MDEEYVKPKQAAKILGCVTRTLRNMEDDGRIKSIRGDSGHRKYNVKEYLQKIGVSKNSGDSKSPERINVCYCRVSSKSQKSDLERQILYIKEKYPTYEIISDIGSGLNFKRRGLKKLLDYSYKGILGEVVVTYKDRLCRFGFELLEDIFDRQSNSKIVVLNKNLGSAESELTEDILQILTVFSAKVHGLRKYKLNIKEDKDLSGQKAETDS